MASYEALQVIIAPRALATSGRRPGVRAKRAARGWPAVKFGQAGARKPYTHLLLLEFDAVRINRLIFRKTGECVVFDVQPSFVAIEPIPKDKPTANQVPRASPLNAARPSTGAFLVPSSSQLT